MQKHPEIGTQIGWVEAGLQRTHKILGKHEANGSEEQVGGTEQIHRQSEIQKQRSSQNLILHNFN